MTIILKTPGRRIKVRRVALDLSQRDLAKAIGVTQAYLSYIENGDRPINPPLLARIAAALECQPDDLLNERRKLL